MGWKLEANRWPSSHPRMDHIQKLNSDLKIISLPETTMREFQERLGVLLLTIGLLAPVSFVVQDMLMNLIDVIWA